VLSRLGKGRKWGSCGVVKCPGNAIGLRDGQMFKIHFDTCRNQHGRVSLYPHSRCWTGRAGPNKTAWRWAVPVERGQVDGVGDK